MSSPEILNNTPKSEPKKVTDISREALAKRLGIDESELPDGKFFRIVDTQLDKLAWLDPVKKAAELKEHLEKIDIAEAADKARELGADGKKLLASEALEQSAGAVKLATEKLKNEWLTHGKEAAVAVWAIVWAKSIDDVTKWVDGIAKVIDATSKTLSGAIESVKDILSSLFKMLGLDKLFKSIGKLLGISSSEESADNKNTPDNSKTSPIDTARDAARKWETPE